MKSKQITPFLWFDGQAEEAAKFYTSVFKNSKITDILRNHEGGPGPAGSVLTVGFELDGTEFVALNGGPRFKFNESVSFVVYCDTQEEIDNMWEKLLSGGGEEQACGWLKDKYGLSWQITPPVLIEYMADKDRVKAKRVMDAMMQMIKIDIAGIQRAYDGR